jgi:hypothetical protein
MMLRREQRVCGESVSDTPSFAPPARGGLGGGGGQTAPSPARITTSSPSVDREARLSEQPGFGGAVHAALSVFTAFSICVTASGDEPAAAEPSAVKALQKLYLTDAEGYEFYADAARQQRLDFVAKPVLHWASHDDWSGDLFVWTRRGRPEIVGCMLSGPANGDRIVFHEFHALNLAPLPTQQLGGGRTWSLAEPGIDWKPLLDAPVPAASASTRLTQMRAISREFTAIMQASEKPWELRLLPQPIYRYPPTAEGQPPTDWLDGALFTFVWTTGTDAEVLLVVEARKRDGEWRWHYAPVRITNREVVLQHRDRQVWQVAAHTEEPGNVTRPYTTFYVKTTPVKE